MANTYADKPASGLSKLQKAMLVWLGERYERYEHAAPELLLWRGAPWERERPSYYGRPLNFVGGRHCYWKSEPQATSRALKRLEERGLVIRHQKNGRTWGVYLTWLGRDVADELRQAGTTSEYKDRRPEAIAWLSTIAKPEITRVLARDVQRELLTVLTKDSERVTCS